ncbi:hypothetical protein [Roseiflexus sp.]|uniref:hypothetical protein n=1 Tax=Roseiflexus sp. TaxID=2562120 RepID=UPI00398B69C9
MTLMKAKRPTPFNHATRIALWTGTLLTLIGLVNRYVIGARGVSSFSALLVGMVITILALIALEPAYVRGAIGGVAVASVIGLLLTYNALPLLRALVLGQPTDGNPILILADGVTLLLCGALLAVCILSFVVAWYRQLRR